MILYGTVHFNFGAWAICLPLMLFIHVLPFLGFGPLWLFASKKGISMQGQVPMKLMKEIPVAQALLCLCWLPLMVIVLLPFILIMIPLSIIWILAVGWFLWIPFTVYDEKLAFAWKTDGGWLVSGGSFIHRVGIREDEEPRLVVSETKDCLYSAFTSYTDYDDSQVADYPLQFCA